MARQVWLEVALNGAWTRKRQPGVPIEPERLIEEGIACAEAGASIVHFHAYDVASGTQNDDPAIYSRVIRSIRDATGAIVYPTLPLRRPNDWASRYDAVRQIGERGLLEWGVVDPGSLNMASYEGIARDERATVYVNTDEDIREGMQLAGAFGYHPGYACYEPGFVRLGAAMRRRYRNAPAPIYRFMFSDELTFGFPPTEWALDAMVRLLEREDPEGVWMVAGLGVDILPLVPAAIERGGHVRVGLEDAPHGNTLTNREWVERAVEAIGGAGGTPATPASIRKELGD